nr:MAG TPA: hypothetical protein [Caudoviricetes sp.]
MCVKSNLMRYTYIHGTYLCVDVCTCKVVLFLLIIQPCTLYEL